MPSLPRMRCWVWEGAGMPWGSAARHPPPMSIAIDHRVHGLRGIAGHMVRRCRVECPVKRPARRRLRP